MRMLLLLVPNGLTATRVAAAFIIPVCFHLEKNPLWFFCELDHRVGLFFAVAIAAATDLLDGYSARALECATEFGRKFDPFADALFCLSIAEVILANGGMSLYAMCFYWAPAVCAFAYTFEVSHMRCRGEICAPNWYAKCAIACFMVGGCALLAHIALSAIWEFEVAGVCALYLGVGFERLSLSEYKKISRSSRQLSTT